MIPIFTVFGAVLIVIAAIFVRGRNKDLEHRERIIALEKGIPLPEPPEKLPKPVHSARRAWGLVMTGIGIALIIGLATTDGAEGTWGWGFMPLAMGVALLIAARFDKREYVEFMSMRAEKPRNGGYSPTG
jgi:hypothetical protein